MFRLGTPLSASHSMTAETSCGTGVDQRRADGIDLEADDVALLEEHGETIRHALPGQPGYASCEHFLDRLGVNGVFPQTAFVGYFHHLAGKWTGKRVLRLGNLHEVGEVRLNARSRGLLLRLRRDAKHDSSHGHGTDSQGFYKLPPLHAARGFRQRGVFWSCHGSISISFVVSSPQAGAGQGTQRRPSSIGVGKSVAD